VHDCVVGGAERENETVRCIWDKACLWCLVNQGEAGARRGHGPG